MTTMPIDIGTLITKSPKIGQGRAVIAGTRVTVIGVIGLHKGGIMPEEIARRKYLTLAQVHAALAYYYANQQQLDNELGEEQTEYDTQAKETTSSVKHA